MDNNYYNNNNNNNSSNQYSDSFYSYNNQQNHGNQNNTQNDSTASQAGGYGSTQSSIYGGQNNSHGSGYGTTQNNSQSANYGSAQNYNQSAGYGSTWNNSQSYGYGNQNGNYGTYGSNPKPEKKKKERKPGGFGTKLAKCAAIALVFGLVSGTAFEGVHLVSSKAFGNDETAVSDSGSQNALTKADNKVEATSTSSNYVATDVSDIVSSVMPSIVAITNVSETEYQSFWGGMPQTYESTSCGSGIIVSQDDNYLYVATNNHVVNGANSLTVTFNDESTVSAEVKGTVPSTDLAVIRVALSSIESDTMNNIKVATLGDSDSLKVGNSCIAIGNALGYGQSVTVGYISALNRQVSVSDSESDTSYTADLIQTDAAINPGNSGGALLSANGEVIGINSVKYSDTSVEGIGYAIPINTAAPIINDLITKEKVDESDSAYLGITGVDVTDDVAKTYNMPSGVYVAQVTGGSAAEQAGIQKGDIITEFDGKLIGSMEELSSTMEYYKAGTTVDVKIERSTNGEYQEQTISVTLGKKN